MDLVLHDLAFHVVACFCAHSLVVLEKAQRALGP